MVLEDYKYFSEVPEPVNSRENTTFTNKPDIYYAQKLVAL